jgi:hypothetical protein
MIMRDMAPVTAAPSAPHFRSLVTAEARLDPRAFVSTRGQVRCEHDCVSVTASLTYSNDDFLEHCGSS